MQATSFRGERRHKRLSVSTNWNQCSCASCMRCIVHEVFHLVPHYEPPPIHKMCVKNKNGPKASCGRVCSRLLQIKILHHTGKPWWVTQYCHSPCWNVSGLHWWFLFDTDWDVSAKLWVRQCGWNKTTVRWWIRAEQVLWRSCSHTQECTPQVLSEHRMMKLWDGEKVTPVQWTVLPHWTLTALCIPWVQSIAMNQDTTYTAQAQKL